MTIIISRAMALAFKLKFIGESENMRKVSYPFSPKSNKFLIPGQFWAIPLESNKFACGRVIEVSKEDKRGFLAGLMDWVGECPPTAEAIAGIKTLKQGDVHIKTIHETGLDGMILDYGPLEEDEYVFYILIQK